MAQPPRQEPSCPPAVQPRPAARHAARRSRESPPRSRVGAGARKCGTVTSPNRHHGVASSAASSRLERRLDQRHRADVQVPVASLRSAGGDDRPTRLHIDQRRTQKTYTIVSSDIGKRMRSASRRPRRAARRRRRAPRHPWSRRRAASPRARRRRPSRQRDRRLPPHRVSGTWVGERRSRTRTSGSVRQGRQRLRADLREDDVAVHARQADQGRTVRLKVVARNSRGNADAFSSATTGSRRTERRDDRPAERRDVRRGQAGPEGSATRGRPGRFSPNPVTLGIDPDHRPHQGQGHAWQRRPQRDGLHPLDAEGDLGRRQAPTATDGWVQYRSCRRRT